MDRKISKDFPQKVTLNATVIKKNIYSKIKKSVKLVQNSMDKNIFEKNDENGEFAKFLSAVQIPVNDRYLDDVKVIEEFLCETDLMNKFKLCKEITEDSYQKMLNICSTFLGYINLKDGEDLFKIDEIADKFYIILKGAVSVLELIETGAENKTLKEVLEIVLQLYYDNERYLLNKFIFNNPGLLCIKNFTEMPDFIKILVKYKISENRDKFNQIEDVENIIFSYKLNFANFHITKDEILEEQNKGYRSFNDYIALKFKFTDEENLKYVWWIRKTFKDNPRKEVNMIEYNSKIILKTGKYFGDYALDNKNKRRTATIRAYGECHLGFVTNKVYEKYIQAEAKNIKNSEICYLTENYFFRIKNKEFDTKYFMHFTNFTYYKGHIIYEAGEPSQNIVLIKEGTLEINFFGSFLEMNQMIVELMKRMVNIKLTPNIIKESEMEEINAFVKDNTIEKLKYKNDNYVKEINKNIKIQISLVSGKDLCGIEEIFLGNLNRYFSVLVHSNSAKIYEVPFKKIQWIFKEETQCEKYYTKLAEAKIFSLVKRLNNIRLSTQEKITKKMEYDENFLEIKYGSTAKTNFESFNRNKRIKINTAMIKSYVKNEHTSQKYSFNVNVLNSEENNNHNDVLTERTSLLRNSIVSTKYKKMIKLTSGNNTNITNSKVLNSEVSDAGNVNNSRSIISRQVPNNFKFTPITNLRDSKIRVKSRIINLNKGLTDSSSKVNKRIRMTSFDKSSFRLNQSKDPSEIFGSNTISRKPNDSTFENISPLKFLKESSGNVLQTIEPLRKVYIENGYRKKNASVNLIVSPIIKSHVDLKAEKVAFLNKINRFNPVKKKEKLYHDATIIKYLKSNLDSFKNQSFGKLLNHTRNESI